MVSTYRHSLKNAATVVTLFLFILYTFSLHIKTIKLVHIGVLANYNITSQMGAPLDLISKTKSETFNNNTIKLLHDPIANKSDVVGFWHIGASNTNNRDAGLFVQKQWNELRVLPMFKDDNITWTMYAVTEMNVTNEIWSRLANESDGRVQYLRPDIISPSAEQPYYEFPTLDMLHKFCVNDHNTDKSVFYIHSKTSDGPRRKMQNHLFQTCHKCLLNNPSKQVCGLHWSEGGFWCHFHGNFWFARCRHVRRLRAPFLEAICKEGWDTGLQHGGWPHDVRPYGRFFAEYWVANDWKDEERKEHHKKPFMKGGGPRNACRIQESDRC